MRGFGDRLRQAREAGGVTLKSIAGATRIQRRLQRAQLRLKGDEERAALA
jgi:cytoskeletal protein RodZ